MKVTFELDSNTDGIDQVQRVLACVGNFEVQEQSFTSAVVPPVPAPPQVSTHVPAPPVPVQEDAPALPAFTAEEEDEDDVPPPPEGLHDRFGVRFNPAVHSSNKKIYEDGENKGKFFKRKGINPAEYDALYASPPLSPAVFTASALAALPAVPVAPPVPTTPVAPPVPAAAPEPGRLNSFVDILQYISKLQNECKVKPDRIKEVLAKHNIASPSYIASAIKENAELIGLLEFDLQMLELAP